MSERVSDALTTSSESLTKGRSAKRADRKKGKHEKKRAREEEQLEAM